MTDKAIPVTSLEPIIKTYRISVLLVGIIVSLYGLTTSVYGYTIRPEKVLMIFLLTLFIPVYFIRKREIEFKKEIVLLALWIVIAFLTSLFSSNRFFALRHWFDLSLSVMFLFLGAIWRLDRIISVQSKEILFLAVILGMGGAIVILLVSFGFYPELFKSLIGVEVGYFRIQLALFEPNLYGAIMMVLALISISLWCPNNFLSWSSVFFSHIGLFLSFSRGPLIGYFVGVIISMFVRGYKLQVFWLIIFTLLGILIASPFSISVHQTDLSKLTNLSNTITDKGESPPNTNKEGLFNRYSSIHSRIVFIKLGIEDIKRAPFFGYGIYSFSFLHPDAPSLVGSNSKGNAWLPTLPIFVIHDTGLVGFFVFSLFFYFLFKNSYHSINKFPDKKSPIVRRASYWMGAAAALLVSSTITPAFSLGAFWLVMAVVYHIPNSLNASGNLISDVKDGKN